MSKTMQVLTAVSLFCGAMASTIAAAQETGYLNVTTVVQKEQVAVNEDGETVTTLVPADTVVPGERVIYTISFRNISDEAADNVVITNPIAETLTYVQGSAFGPGAEVQFSVDGGQSYAAFDALRVADGDSDRPASVDDLTHIRWILKDELAAGAQGLARFTAVLN